MHIESIGIWHEGTGSSIYLPKRYTWKQVESEVIYLRPGKYKAAFKCEAKQGSDPNEKACWISTGGTVTREFEANEYMSYQPDCTSYAKPTISTLSKHNKSFKQPEAAGTPEGAP